VIAGHVESVMFLRQEVQKPELELTLQVCYVIFVTVVITVALYCLLMVLVLTRKAVSVAPAATISSNRDFDRAWSTIWLTT
jgi:hypothetical protein